jgi:formate/nitrite transporter FocA (FNT family)
MGGSLFAEGLLQAHLPDAPWRPLVVNFGYSIGFIFVILGRQQLFTENTLTPILPLLVRRTWECMAKVLRLWAIVLSANLVGATFFAIAVVKLDIVSPGVRMAMLEIGRGAMMHDVGSIFVRAVLAGWLIAMMVWLLPAAQQQLPVILVVTYFVGLGGLSHIVAGAVETLAVVVSGGRSVGDWLSAWLLPTLMGNIVGGLLLVAALNHAQVISGRPRNGPAR